MRSYGNRKRERLRGSIEVGSSESGSRGWRSTLFETAQDHQQRRKPKMLVHSSLSRVRLPAPFVVPLRMMVNQQLCLELLPVQVSNA